MRLGSVTLLQAGEGGRGSRAGRGRGDVEDTTSGKQANEKECSGTTLQQTARAAETNNLGSVRISYCVKDIRLRHCEPFVLKKKNLVLMSIKLIALNSSVDHTQVVSVQGEVQVNDQQRELFASARHSRAVLCLNANELHDN